MAKLKSRVLIALTILMFFYFESVFANEPNEQQNRELVPDRDVLRQVLENLSIGDVANYAATSKAVRDQMAQAGYNFNLVEISSLQQLRSDYPKSKLFNVKFHSDISKKGLFDCLMSPTIVGNVDAHSVSALSDREKMEIENGLVMSLPMGDEFDVSYSPDGKTIVGVKGNESIQLWDFSTGELKHVLVLPRMQNTRTVRNPIKISKDSKFILMRLRIVNNGQDRFEEVLFDMDSVRTVQHPDASIIWAVNPGRDVVAREISVENGHSFETVHIRGREEPFRFRVDHFAGVGPEIVVSNDWTKSTVTGVKSRAMVTDLETEQIKKFVHIEPSIPFAMTYEVEVGFSPDSNKLITHNKFYGTKVWDITSEKLLLDKPLYYNSSFSPDGNFILTQFPKGNTTIWNAKRAFNAYTMHMNAEKKSQTFSQKAKKKGSQLKAKFKESLKKILKK